MRYLSLFVLGCLISAFIAVAPPDNKPVFSFVGKNGDTLSSGHLKNRITIIYFWASWNQHSRKLNRELVKTYADYRVKWQKAAMKLDIAAVSLDEQPEFWHAAIHQDDLHWPYNYCDLRGWEGQYIQTFQVKRIPSMVLINSSGEVVAKDLFGQPLREKLDSMLVSN